MTYSIAYWNIGGDSLHNSMQGDDIIEHTYKCHVCDFLVSKRKIFSSITMPCHLFALLVTWQTIV